MKVLVSAASKHGATSEIAQAVADALAARASRSRWFHPARPAQ
jgi:menaquinone-dependent protoporphyrinogen IX oxidase